MEYKNIVGTGLSVSKFCLGTMMFGGQTNEEDANKIIDYALDQGINFFDTANIYTKGECESIIGKALKGKRDNAVIATKVGGPSWDGPNGRGLGRKHVMKSIDNSLKRLQTDYVDVFYMHFPDPNVPMEETIETMNLLIDSGKIRYYAVSNYSAWQICSMIEKARSMHLQAPVLTETVYNAITRGADEELMPFLKEYGLGLAIYNPLAGGLLTGKHTREHAAESSRMSEDKGYRARYWNDNNWDAVEYLSNVAKDNGMDLLELAIRWSISRPEVSSAIIGVSRIEQLKQNIEIVNKGGLPEDVFKSCDKAWEQIKGAYYNYHR